MWVRARRRQRHPGPDPAVLSTDTAPREHPRKGVRVHLWGGPNAGVGGAQRSDGSSPSRVAGFARPGLVGLSSSRTSLGPGEPAGDLPVPVHGWDTRTHDGMIRTQTSPRRSPTRAREWVALPVPVRSSGPSPARGAPLSWLCRDLSATHLGVGQRVARTMPPRPSASGPRPTRPVCPGPAVAAGPAGSSPARPAG